MNKLDLITFNDDNHAERFFLNGTYIGDSSNIAKVFENAIPIIKDLNDEYIFNEISVYVCDDFDEEDEDSIDDIWDYFNNVEAMSSKEIKLIKNKDWEGLSKLLKESKE